MHNGNKGSVGGFVQRVCPNSSSVQLKPKGGGGDSPSGGGLRVRERVRWCFSVVDLKMTWV